MATRVLPSPVTISAILPPCRTIPPINWTSKCRMFKITAAGFAAGRECLGQEVVERFARRVAARRNSSVLARSSSPDSVGKLGSSSLIRATIGRIWRICRSFELPNSRTSPSETFSERAVKASVVLSQRSLSSSIAPLAPRKWKRSAQ